MSAGRASPGFSLIELVVTVSLVMIVFMAMLSLQDTLLRDKGQVLRQITVRNQADYSRRLLLRDLAEATVIEMPGPGDSMDEVVGWKNLDPKELTCADCPDGRRRCRPFSPVCSAPAEPSLNQNFISLVDGIGPEDGKTSYGDDAFYFRYCWTTDRRLIRYHGPVRRGTANDSNLPPDVPCGQPSPNEAHGETMDAIAGVPPGTVRVERQDGEDGLFTRPPGIKNFIQLDYAVISTGPVGGIIDTARADVAARAVVLLPAR